MPSAERPPFAAYKGPDPYVFVSYAHKDAALVFSAANSAGRLGHQYLV